MSQQFFGTDSFVDSEELMSWLLLNPEFDLLTGTNGSFPVLEQSNSNLSPNCDPPEFSTGYPMSSSMSDDGYRSEFLPNQELLHPNFLVPSESELRAKKELQKVKASTPRELDKKGSKIPRKRPRESLDDLENRVKELRAENADLHAHLLNVTQRTTEVQKQRVAMERLMASKLSDTPDKNEMSQQELADLVKQYTDLYADYGKCRQREVAFHLQQLEKLILPTQTTKMCLWALNQDKSFFEKSKSPIIDILTKELEITPEQLDKILDRREKIAILLSQLQETLELLQGLKVHIEQKHATYDQICGRVQSAANPKQTVKFLMWITNNAEALGKYISGFRQSSHPVPNAELVNKFANELNVDSLNSNSREEI